MSPLPVDPTSADLAPTDPVPVDPPRPHLDRRRFLQWTGALGAAFGVSAPSFAFTAAGAAPRALTPRQEASRFLAQATFGGDLELVDAVVAAGPAAWLDGQMALPVEPFIPRIFELFEDGTGGEDGLFLYFDWVWWEQVLTSPDVLRQRIAFVLSQMFVISRRTDELFDNSLATGAFWDVLARNAFGNFRDLLLEVALQPSMGMYLSHLNNRRSDPAVNRFPDENFAREVMQLFTIGLFELEPDGTRRLDAEGQPIPTYGNAEITEMAKIFTGLTLAPEDGEPVIFGEEWETLHLPMVMFEAEHEPGPKTLLGGFVVPAGQTGMEDIEMAIDHLFRHPNVGPFLGSHLIRFLVTSNPSPAYVARVAAAFDDNGGGVRGDMKAVIRAVLLDPEARNSANLEDPHFGKVREPLVRWVQLGRAFHATSDSGLFRHFGVLESGDDGEGGEGFESVFLAQYPLFAPSVFNFFSPTHQPAGPLADAGLVAPEMEIIHAYTSIATANAVFRALFEEEYISDLEETVWLDLDTEVDIAAEDPEALLDHLDLLLTYGTLSAATRTFLRDAILPLSEEPEEQVMTAIFLMMISPEYAVQR
ncbi:MAG: DUF1800 family protein [Acidobacteriota bacterium]